MSFENVRLELKKRNLTDQEIEMIFAKYDTDNNRELDESELKKLFDDLEGKKLQLQQQIEKEESSAPTSKRPQSAISVVASKASPEEVFKLVRRMDRMEYTLSVISSKIDAVLSGHLILPKNDSNGNKEV